MSVKILPKKSSVAAKVPLAGDLDVGEIAINLADKKLYSKDGGGSVVVIGNGASELYVQSRGEGLVTNGTGLLEDNTNFSTFDWAPGDTFSGKGSFDVTSTSTTRFNDEFIPVDTNATYRLSTHMKNSGPAVSRHYSGIASYDVDGLSISPTHTMIQAGTKTTLAAPLAPGDTTIVVDDLSGWNNTSTETYLRSVQLWGYQNSFGHRYDDYTYTRFSLQGAYDTASLNFATNTITLRFPLSSVYANPNTVDGVWPVGTAISNGSSGGGYKYIGSSNAYTTDDWVQYTGTIGELDTDHVNSGNKFHPGTAFVRLLYLLNRSTAGGVSTTTKLSNISFAKDTEVTEQLASDAMPRSGGTFTGDIALDQSDGNSRVTFSNPGAPRSNFIGMNASDEIVIAADDNNEGSLSKVQIKVDGSAVSDFTEDGLSVTGDIYVSGTVDGRDIAADGVVLDNALSASYLSVRPLADANAADTQGVNTNYLTSSAVNDPTGTDHALLTLSYSSDFSYQLAGDWRTGKTYARGQSSNAWGDWKQLYTEADFDNNATNWDEAYSWGDHATEGYLTSVPAQSWASITGKPSTFTPSTHSHTIADVTGLQAELDEKATIAYVNSRPVYNYARSIAFGGY